MEYTEVLDKQITRKQHYVPKAYLKNFSVSNQKSEQVYVVFANDENAILTGRKCPELMFPIRKTGMPSSVNPSLLKAYPPITLR